MEVFHINDQCVSHLLVYCVIVIPFCQFFCLSSFVYRFMWRSTKKQQLMKAFMNRERSILTAWSKVHKTFKFHHNNNTTQWTPNEKPLQLLFNILLSFHARGFVLVGIIKITIIIIMLFWCNMPCAGPWLKDNSVRCHKTWLDQALLDYLILGFFWVFFACRHNGRFDCVHYFAFYVILCSVPKLFSFDCRYQC